MAINYLFIAGILSFIASLLHVSIILGGASWYRFFGAGERMARQAEINPIKPAIVTLGIALIFIVWGLYALSGAGYIQKLPFLKLVLIVITGIYWVRGMGGIVAPFLSQHAVIKENSKAFWLWSSLICLIFGGVHLLGVITRWPFL